MTKTEVTSSFGSFPEEILGVYRCLLKNLKEFRKIENGIVCLGAIKPVKKNVKGIDYYYFQGTSLNGKQKQVYLGPRTLPVLEDEKQREKLKEIRREYLDKTEMLVRALRAAGMRPFSLRQGRVITALADAGIFDVSGGVLLGNAALCCIAQSHGLRLPAEPEESDVIVAIPSIPKTQKNPLSLLERGISPLNRFDPVANPFVPLNRTGNRAIRFLCLWNEPGEKAALLKFLVKQPEHAIAFCRKPVLVAVPDSTRYLVFEIISSQLPVDGSLVADTDLSHVRGLYKVFRGKEQFAQTIREARATDQKWQPLLERGLQILNASMD